MLWNLHFQQIPGARLSGNPETRLSNSFTSSSCSSLVSLVPPSLGPPGAEVTPFPYAQTQSPWKLRGVGREPLRLHLCLDLCLDGPGLQEPGLSPALLSEVLSPGTHTGVQSAPCPFPALACEDLLSYWVLFSHHIKCSSYYIISPCLGEATEAVGGNSSTTESDCLSCCPAEETWGRGGESAVFTAWKACVSGGRRGHVAVFSVQLTVCELSVFPTSPAFVNHPNKIHKPSSRLKSKCFIFIARAKHTHRRPLYFLWVTVEYERKKQFAWGLFNI